ncbi:hypothetical protein M8C21_011124 [Ambrosia artemisiifolia]|uniref:Uncharacterized protein n=1 Tax=Ambrosia artemisiifolia TaxID=4212 RepID=A0AAD5C7H6_AMBAR|nr:hypothetical protein M8C21_011124 [Ambrosia artemisiifolia]
MIAISVMIFLSLFFSGRGAEA